MDTGGKAKKGAGGRNGGGPRKKFVSRSVKDGLQFSVGRISRDLKNGGYFRRIGIGAQVYAAAVLEYIVSEFLELAGNVTRAKKKRRIVPIHLTLAARNDEDLGKLFDGVTIARCGEK